VGGFTTHILGTLQGLAVQSDAKYTGSDARTKEMTTDNHLFALSPDC
jgi:hypothetical protein